MDVAISNQQQLVDIDEGAIRAAASQILTDSHVASGALSIAIVDDEAIHELNRQYLQHDYATDVLSFDLSDPSGNFAGEVIVSAETAARLAGENEIAPHNELMLYIVHGTLHLVGYNDKSADEQAAMRRAEAKYLQQFGCDSCKIGTLFTNSGD